MCDGEILVLAFHNKAQEFFPAERQQFAKRPFTPSNRDVCDPADAPHPSLTSRTKRRVDLFGAIFLLLICSPILALAALLVNLTSRGPVIYSCEPIGRYGKPFVMYKIRTMTRHADEQERGLHARQGSIFIKPNGDRRITFIGAILRRLSIDELPQLINVLKGDMSFVGPRPIKMPEALRLPEGLCDNRFGVQPGISGLWQVSGRSNLPDEARITLDHDYVEHWSLALDWHIILKTVLVVLNANGAR